MTNQLLHTRRAQQGFTLIELSIVLVIIGLIVGGVLVGQDLIRAAEIRATVTQIEKYNTAVNTFRGKYNGIPGDLASASASAFGLFYGGGGTGLGDGNGLIEAGASGAVGLTGEGSLFWSHLSLAGYTDGQFGGSTQGTSAGQISTAGAVVDPTTLTTVTAYIPQAKLGRGNSVAVGATGGVNYFIIGSFAQGTSSGVWAAATSDTLTPTEAYNIDRKTDDGLPGTGTIVAMSTKTAALTTSTLLGNAGSANNDGPTAACTQSAGGSNYYLSTSFGTTPACALRIRFN